MSRILHHVGSKDFKKTHQRHLDEQRALYLERREKEIQEEKERKKVEEAAKSLKSDWRSTLTESEWYAISGSGPTNSTSQTFAFGDPGSGIETTVSGIGGQDAYSSTVTIDGETYDAPTYNQLALQGYTPLMQMQRRIDPQNVNSKLDASQQFTQNVGADYMMGARVTSTESQKSFMDAYLEVQEKWAKIIDPLQYELQTKYAGQMAPKDLVDKINSLIAQQDAELEALSKKYAGIEPSQEVAQVAGLPRLNAMGDRNMDIRPVMDPVFAVLANLADKVPAKKVFDYYSDVFLKNLSSNPVGSSPSNPLDITKMMDKKEMLMIQTVVDTVMSDVNLTKNIDKENEMNSAFEDLTKTIFVPTGLGFDAQSTATPNTRNIIGQLDPTKFDGFHIQKDGTVILKKSYDFDVKPGDNDFGASGGLGGIIASIYAGYKGVKDYVSSKTKETPTMYMQVVFNPTKNKRRKKRQNESTTWNRIKKHLKGA